MKLGIPSTGNMSGESFETWEKDQIVFGLVYLKYTLWKVGNLCMVYVILPLVSEQLPGHSTGSSACIQYNLDFKSKAVSHY